MTATMKEPRVGVGDPAGVAAEHEHRAVREVEDAERAVDDRQARRRSAPVVRYS